MIAAKYPQIERDCLPEGHVPVTTSMASPHKRGIRRYVSGVARYLDSMITQLAFLWMNVSQAKGLPKIGSTSYDAAFFRGCQRSDLAQVCELYKQLNSGMALPALRRFLYWLVGQKLCVVALSNMEKKTKGRDCVIGFSLYYFNERDVKEQSIHEAFMGVSPSEQGKGVSTAFRRFTYAHFSKTSLKGVSCRISADNRASLSGARKAGHEPVEQYFDQTLGLSRFYLFCDLAKYRDQ